MMNLANQKGYALLMTLAILFAMLSLVLPLAVMNRKQIKSGDGILEETQARWMIQSGRNLARYVSKSKSDYKNNFMRQHNLPGWEDFPIRFKLKNDLNAGIKIIEVYNIRPYFMNMAKHIGQLTPSSMDTTTTTVTVPGNAPMTGTGSGNIFLLVGNELMTTNTSGGPPYSVVDRGVAGAKQNHAVGTDVFAVQDAFGYVKIEDEWLEVDGYRAEGGNLGGMFTVNIRGFAGTEDVIHYKDEFVEFYPAFPNLDAGGIRGVVSVKVTDEGSKINLNSMTDHLQRNLLNFDGLGFNTLYREVLSGNTGTSDAIYPFAHPISLLRMQDSDYSNAGTDMRQDLFNMVMSYLTTYTEPTYNHVMETFLSGNAISSAGNNLINISNSTDPNISTSLERYVPIHSVNFNLAPVGVMEMVLTGLGSGANVMSAAKAKDLAERIQAYRSGEFVSSPDYAPHATEKPDYFDGDENPFDGHNIVGGGTSRGTAREEFASFLHGLSNSVVDGVMKKAVLDHVYAEDYLDFFSYSAFTAPISFETTNVKQISTSINIIRGSDPGVVKLDKGVFKDVSSREGLVGAISTNTIKLDSINYGWNESMSTFEGLTAAVPYCASSNSSVMVLKTSPESSFAFGGNLIAYLGGNPPFRVDMRSELNASDNTMVCGTGGPNISDFSDFGVPVDFGMRLKTHENYEKRIATIRQSTVTSSPHEIEVYDISPFAGIDGCLVIQSTDTYVFKYTASSVNILANKFEDLTLAANNLSLSAPSYEFSDGDKVNFYPFKYTFDNSWNWPGVVPGSTPYYETVLVKDNAEWHQISWVAEQTYGAIQVQYRPDTPNGATPWSTATSTSPISLSALASDKLYLRFTFKKDERDYQNAISPQLMSVSVDYTIKQGKRNVIKLGRK